MRLLALAAAAGLLIACRADSIVDDEADHALFSDEAEEATFDAAPTLREIVAQNAANHESLERLGADGITGVPMARGGGPKPEVFWPSQARDALANARCKASCAGDHDACLVRERERLARWAVDGCERIELAGCLDSVRQTACEDVDWTLSQSCAPSRVCASAN